MYALEGCDTNKACPAATGHALGQHQPLSRLLFGSIPMKSENATFVKRALSIEETARTCGLSRATIYRLIEKKKLATLKIGARRLVRPEALDALLREGA
jgi:excisionase family DNA binding protein